MKLFKFLWSVSPATALRIVLLALLNGSAGGLLLIAFPNAAIDVYSKSHVLFYALFLPITAMVFLASRHWVQRETEALAGQAVANLVLEVGNTVRWMELPEFQQANRSDILLSIANAQTISDAACKQIESLQAYITLFVGWLYISFFISPLFGLILLVARLLLLLVQEMFGKIIFSFVRAQLEEEKAVFVIFRHHLYGFKELKFHQQKNEDIFQNFLLPKIEAGKRLRIISKRYGAELVLAGMLIQFCLMACCTSFPLGLTAEDISRILIILLFTLQNDLLINASIQSVIEGRAALEQLQRLFPGDQSRTLDEEVRETQEAALDAFETLTLDRVAFSYPAVDNGAGFGVRIDDLTILAGEVLFVVGGNGSGKSTCMNLLTGLFPPSEGRILVDGQPVSTTNYRRLFTAVFADFHLFDRLYGLKDVDAARVHELLRLTELDAKTTYEDECFSTQDLSTGQRKRLALVIAMMEDYPIFMFDEWAADQDPYFRRYFYEEIIPALKAKGKTIIAVTHDDRYFHLADKVVQMADGRIEKQWRPSADFKASSKKPERFIAAPPNVAKPAAASGSVASSNGELPKESMAIAVRQVFGIAPEALRRLLLCLLTFAVSLVSLTVILLHLPMQAEVPTLSYLAFIVLLGTMVISFRELQKRYHTAVEERIAALQVTVVNQARQTDLMTLKQVGIGRIYTALTADIRVVASTSEIILFCFLGGVRMGLIYLYVTFLYLPAGLMMFFLTALGAMVYLLNHMQLVKLFEAVREQEKKLFEAVNHLLYGFKELKLSARKSNDFYQRSLVKHTARLRDIQRQSMRYYTNNATVTYGFWKIILLLLLLVLPAFGMPAAVLPVTVALVLTMPLRQIIDKYAQFHMAYLSIQRLFRFESRMKGLAQEAASGTVAVLPPYQSIHYEGITFTYPAQDNRPFSIGPVNVDVAAGEVVFITGGNGSGKSTLLNLLTGLYPTDGGRLLYNGQQEIDIRQCRELFGSVFTDFHLFDMLYGMPTVDEPRLNELLDRFGLGHKVQWRDGKFSTLDLSTGQKKRLALVITILEDKPIYILDEWAADQDPSFRDYFYMILLPEFKAAGKTVLAVSHDDLYFHTADRVLHLEYGRLTDRNRENPVQKEGVSG